MTKKFILMLFISHVFLFSAKVWAQPVEETDKITPPPLSESDSKQTENADTQEPPPPSPSDHAPPTQPPVRATAVPPHLKSWAGSISWRITFDRDGRCGGAMFAAYYYPNYFLALEANISNLVSMTFTSPVFGDRNGSVVGIAATYFPFKYHPEGSSYYFKLGGIYENIRYLYGSSLRGEEANYFGFEVGGGVMYTWRSKVSLGVETLFLGSFTGDTVESFEVKSKLGPLDRTAFVLKLYFLIRWSLARYVQGPDGKFYGKLEE